MWSGILRELNYLLRNKWDLALVTLAPLFIIFLFSSMFYAGKAEHLPIAIIDQDQSELSRTIEKYLSHNQSLSVATITNSQDEAEHLLNQTKIWGYVLIPSGAEQRLVKAQDAQIAIAFNQSFFSIGNTISSAMMLGTLQAIAEFTGDDYLGKKLPYLDAPTPNIKISTLYNPGLNYEFYLEPFVVPAILHLLLCCCVAFSVGQEIKRHTLHGWLNQGSLFVNLMAKILVYVSIFCLWTWLWMFWLIVIRGWFVAGSLSLIIVAQILFYFAYAVISCSMVLATKNLSKTFGLIAVYGGSSLSFAGVTLPLNNAPLFTKFWANIIPFTPYAKLQTEQWVIGSPLYISLYPLALIFLYCVIYTIIALFLLKKIWQEAKK